MQKLASFITAIIFIFTTAPIPLMRAQTPQGGAPVIITEIAAFETSDREWIEIFNTTAASIDITDWKFYENETNHRLTAIRGDMILETNEYAIIVNKEDVFQTAYPDFQGTVIDSSWTSLNEDGEEIGIVDNNSNFIERLVYPALTGDTSLERVDEITWQHHATGHSMGMSTSEVSDSNDVSDVSETNEASEVEESVTNTVTDTVTDTVDTPVIDQLAPYPVLLINEVSFKDPENDWIELFMKNDQNNGNGFDIAGLTAEDDSIIFTFPANTVVKTGEFVIVENAKLTATSEQIIIKAPDFVILDAVCWSNDAITESEQNDLNALAETESWISNDPAQCVKSTDIKAKESIGRQNDIDTNSMEDWKIFPHPTPSAVNVITNQDPIPAIDIQEGMLEKEIPLSINLTAELSSDPDGDSLSYFWDFGDGTSSESANPPSHPYGTPGIYTIRLRVTDAVDASAETTVTVNALAKNIQTQPPQPEPAQTITVQTQPAPIEPAKIQSATSAKLVQTNLQKTPIATQETQKKSTQRGAAKTKARRFVSEQKTKKIDGNETKVSPQTNSVSKTKKSLSTKTKKSKKPTYSNGDLSTTIHITEIMPNPDGEETEEEWIELWNTGTQRVNLGNWKLDDDEKGSKPYTIPDTVSVGPDGIIVISRSDSKIALNNTKDRVRLFDFKGVPIDEISYEQAKKDMSFALIEIRDEIPSVDNNTAHAAAAPPRWEWTRDITPGKTNPTYASLSGTVIELLENETAFMMETADGTVQKISFSAAVLDPLMARVALPDRASVRLIAKQADMGTYDLHELTNVIPAAVKKKSAGTRWLLILFLVASISINVYFIAGSPAEALTKAGSKLRDRFIIGSA